MTDKEINTKAAVWRLIEQLGFEEAHKRLVTELPRIPAAPTPGLLMSMALRYDHGLGCPGYYDQLAAFSGNTSQPTHEQRLKATLSTMRQLHEEVSGRGFYRPELEEAYAANYPKS